MRWWVAGLGAALALGCAHRPAAAVAVWPAVSPAALVFPRTATQSVTVVRGGEEHTFVAQLEDDGARLVVAAVSPVGQRLFLLVKTEAGVTAEASPMIPSQFKPEHVLADLELAFAPAATLRAAFAGTPWTLEETARARTLRYDGQEVAVVRRGADDPWAAPLSLENRRYGYTLRVETLERDVP